MTESKYGPCGLYCGACGAEDCGGCQSDRIDETITNCKFRGCTMEKGIDFCCYCDEYPCRELRDFMNDEWPHHWTVELNLEFIKEKGVEEWLEAQKKEWSCKACGVETVWYQKECRCGQDLEAWDVPEH
jgi:hypothetical protein